MSYLYPPHTPPPTSHTRQRLVLVFLCATSVVAIVMATLWYTQNASLSQNKTLTLVASVYPESAGPEQPEPGFLLQDIPVENTHGFARGSCPSGQLSGAREKLFYPVNKMNPVGSFVPADLVEVQDTLRTKAGRIVCLDTRTANALVAMFEAAEQEGHKLIITSGYRSPETQLSLYNNAIEHAGFLGTRRVAPAFHSEHQLGTSVDLSGMSVQQASGSGVFEFSPEGGWVRENAHRFGFVQSYQHGKEEVTGYMAEAWHWRFVGTKNAQAIYDSGLSLHEVLNDPTTNIIDTPATSEIAG